MRHRSNAFVENMIDQENLIVDVTTLNLLTRNSDSTPHKSTIDQQPILRKTDELKQTTTSQAKTDPKKPSLRDIDNYRVRNTLG